MAPGGGRTDLPPDVKRSAEGTEWWGGGGGGAEAGSRMVQVVEMAMVKPCHFFEELGHKSETSRYESVGRVLIDGPWMAKIMKGLSIVVSSCQFIVISLRDTGVHCLPRGPLIRLKCAAKPRKNHAEATSCRSKRWRSPSARVGGCLGHKELNLYMSHDWAMTKRCLAVIVVPCMSIAWPLNQLAFICCSRESF